MIVQGESVEAVAGMLIQNCSCPDLVSRADLRPTRNGTVRIAILVRKVDYGQFGFSQLGTDKSTPAVIPQSGAQASKEHGLRFFRFHLIPNFFEVPR